MENQNEKSTKKSSFLCCCWTNEEGRRKSRKGSNLSQNHNDNNNDFYEDPDVINSKLEKNHNINQNESKTLGQERNTFIEEDKKSKNNNQVDSSNQNKKRKIEEDNIDINIFNEERKFSSFVPPESQIIFGSYNGNINNINEGSIMINDVTNSINYKGQEKKIPTNKKIVNLPYRTNFRNNSDKNNRKSSDNEKTNDEEKEEENKKQDSIKEKNFEHKMTKSMGLTPTKESKKNLMKDKLNPGFERQHSYQMTEERIKEKNTGLKKSKISLPHISHDKKNNNKNLKNKSDNENDLTIKDEDIKFELSEDEKSEVLKKSNNNITTVNFNNERKTAGNINLSDGIKVFYDQENNKDNEREILTHYSKNNNNNEKFIEFEKIIEKKNKLNENERNKENNNYNEKKQKKENNNDGSWDFKNSEEIVNYNEYHTNPIKINNINNIYSNNIENKSHLSFSKKNPKNINYNNVVEKEIFSIDTEQYPENMNINPINSTNKVNDKQNLPDLHYINSFSVICPEEEDESKRYQNNLFIPSNQIPQGHICSIVNKNENLKTNKISLSKRSENEDYADEIDDEVGSIDEFKGTNDTKSMISSYVFSALNKSDCKSINQYSILSKRESGELHFDSCSNFNDINSDKGDSLIPPFSLGKELEVSNENGFAPNVKNFNIVKAQNNMMRLQSLNNQTKKIMDKIRVKDEKISKIKEDINKFIDKMNVIDEKSKLYDRWLEQEEAEHEILSHMFNFLCINNNK